MSAVKRGRPRSCCTLVLLLVALRRLNDSSLSQIAQSMNTAAIPTPSGLQEWTKGIVSSLLAESTDGYRLLWADDPLAEVAAVAPCSGTCPPQVEAELVRFLESGQCVEPPLQHPAATAVAQAAILAGGHTDLVPPG